MKLTPLDIQQQQFRRELSGFDRREVNAFLELISHEVARLTGELNELKADMRRSARELEEYKARESTLKEAMLTAQRAIEEIREQAQKEAQLVVSESELKAERIIHHAHTRVTKILEEVGELRRQRARAIEEMRGILKTHSRLLEVHDDMAAEDGPEASVTVLERLRAPAPPAMADLGLMDVSG